MKIKYWIWIILATSVITRVGAAVMLGQQVLPLPAIFDQISYHNLAIRVLEGHGFSFGTQWWPMTRDGTGFVSRRGAQRDRRAPTMVTVGADDRALRHEWPAVIPLELVGPLRHSRDGSVVYGAGSHRDGRVGVWAIPTAGGAPRLVVGLGDPTRISSGFLSLGSDRLYLTVMQVESDIWVADLKR